MANVSKQFISTSSTCKPVLSEVFTDGRVKQAIETSKLLTTEVRCIYEFCFYLVVIMSFMFLLHFTMEEQG